MYHKIDIYLGDKQVGSGKISREGLYYNISCRYSFSGKVMYRLILQSPKGIHDLGICIPEQGQYILQKRIPISKVGEGDLSIYPVPKGTREKDCFIPVFPDEPFAYLSRLKNAVLEYRDGKPGVKIPMEDQSSISKPTGQ